MAHLDDSSQAGKCRRHMQPFCLHGRCVHVGLIGGSVEDLEFRLWGQLQTDVTHQDADNGKGTCGAPPSQQKSEVCRVPMAMVKGSSPGTCTNPFEWLPTLGSARKTLYQKPSLSCHRHFPRSYTPLSTLSHWTPTPNASSRAWTRNQPHVQVLLLHLTCHLTTPNIPAENSHFSNLFGLHSIWYILFCHSLPSFSEREMEQSVLRAHML